MAQPTTAHAARTETEAPRTHEVETPRGRVHTHSGSGRLAENLTVFIVLFAILCGAIVCFSFWTRDIDSLPIFLLGLLCYVVTFVTPLWLLNSKTARAAKTGGGTTME